MGDVEAQAGGRRPFRLAVEAGSETLKAAFEQAPCGCLLAEEAALQPDPAARSGLQKNAEQRAKAWGCERAGYAGRKHGPAERECAAKIKELCGLDTQSGCPREALYRDDVQRACDFKQSSYSPLVEPDPPQILLDIVLRVLPHQESKLLERIRKTPPQISVQEQQGPVTSPDQLPRRRGRQR